MVPEGGDSDGEGDDDGEGDEVQVHPPPPSLVLPIPELLQKAPGTDSAVCRKAAAAPLCAQVLEEGYGPDQPTFSDSSKGHHNLRWVMGRLFPCLTRKNEEGKREWRTDATKGCDWQGQPLPGSPMSPLPERISSGTLGALNLLADPCGVRFVTGHCVVCLQHCLALDWCQWWRQGMSVQFAPVWSALLSLPTTPTSPRPSTPMKG